MKWTVFCNAEDRFSWVWAFLQKKSFWSLNAQNHFFRASKNTNSVFSATKQIMRMRGPQTAQKLLSQWEKVAKCNFKSKAQVHEKCFFLMKWTVFCNAGDRFSWVWAFLQKKSFWSLNAQNHFFRASRTPILCLVQLSKLWECEATDAQKLLSQWEKVAKCNFKSKAQVHEKCFFLMKWTVFCNAEDRFSWVWAFLQKKSF